MARRKRKKELKLIIKKITKRGRNFWIWFKKSFLKKKKRKRKKQKKEFERIEFPLFPSFFGWQAKLAFVKIKKKIFLPFKKYWQELLALVLIIASISLSFFFYPSKKTIGATYTWYQNDWSGGASTATAVHPDNQTGWNYYYEKGEDVIATTSVSLATAGGYVSETSDVDFQEGTFDKTQISGSGDSASIILLPPTTTTTDDFLDSSKIASSNNIVVESSQVKLATSSESLILRPDGPGDYTNISGVEPTGAEHWSVVDEAIADDSDYVYEGYEQINADVYALEDPTSQPGEIQEVRVCTRSYYSGFGGDLTPRLRLGTNETEGSTVSYSSWTLNCQTLDRPGGGSWSWTDINNLQAGAKIGAGPDSTLYLSQLYVEVIYSTYPTSGSFQSTNLLEGQSVGPIWSFSYYLSSLPGGSSAKVSFSQDGTNWFNSSGTADGWDTMSEGEHTIDLSGLGWEGPNFYYKIEFSSDGSATPVLEWVKVHTNYPSSGTFISQILDTGKENPLYTTLEFSATTTAETSVKIQLRADDSTSTLSSLDFVGPDGTTSTFYTSSGQEIWEGHSGKRYIQYKVILETTDNTQTPYFNEIKISYGISSYLISSPYDTKDPGNVLAKIEWEGDTPSSTEIKFQIRSSPDGINWTPWCGPDDADDSTSTCATSTYFTDPSGGETMDEMFKDGVDDRYFQYKVYLSTTGSEVPTLTSVTFTYAVNAPPEFNPSSPADAHQEATGEVKINYSIRDPDTTQGTVQPNYVTPSFEYSLDGGVSWSSIDCSYMASGDCDNKFVEEENFTDYTAIWDAKSQIGQVYTQNAKIRITVDDKEAANNTASTSTSAFELDTKDPQNPQVVVDASTQYGTNDATLYLSVSDDTIEAGVRGSMMISTTSTFSDASWQDYATSTTFHLPSDPSTVYVKFKDAYGNVSAIASVTTPPTPDGVYCQDVSNADEGVYRLFVGWNVVDLPPQGDFDRYIILKSTSTDPATFEKVAEITDRNQNYWMDSDVEYGKTYYYQVLSKDTLGNVSFRSEMVSGTPGSGGEDNLPPSFVSGPTASEIYTTQVTISWETDELSRAILHYGTSPGSYTLSKSVNTYATSHAVVLGGLQPNTTYYLKVEAIDTSDNSAVSSEISFTTQDGPVISNVSVSQVFNEKATIFWLTDVSADSYVYYSTSTQGPFLSTGKTESVTQHEITIENLEPGTRYYFYVKSSNAIDNNEGNYYSFITTNDTKPPQISNLSAWTTAYTAVIVWQTDELSDSFIEWGTSSGSYTFSTSSDVDTIYHVIRLTDLTENQTYYYKVKSTDPNGNFTESTERTFTPVRERDTTPPVISNVSISDVYTTQVKISWQTDELSDSIVEYSTSSDFSSYLTKTDSQMVKSHSIVLTGLLPNTTYYFRVKSKDVEANEAQKSGFSFKTLDGPIISNVVVSQVFNEKATIEWETDIPATSTVVYSLNPDFSSYFEETDNEKVIYHKITLTGLSPGAVYYFYVKSGNAIDNNGGDYYFFSTAYDTQAPQISNITVLEKAHSALILWETDELATSKIVYGTSSTALNYEVSDNVLTRKHHVLTLSGLEENTQYYFKVISCDANSNCSESSLNSFTTLILEEPKEGDTTPPQISDVSVKVLSSGSVIISWKTDELSDSTINYGKTKPYTQKIISSDLTLDHVVEISNLEPATTYHFQIVSTDSSGNTSFSPDYSFTTQAFFDTTPPVISNVSVSSLSATSVVISWTTNEKANSIVEYGRDSSLGFLAGSLDDFVKNHSVKIVNLSPSTLYYFRVRSEDQAGNTTIDNNQGLYYKFKTKEALPEESLGEALKVAEKSSGNSIEKIMEKLSQNPYLKDVKEKKFLDVVSKMAEKIVKPPLISGGAPQIKVGSDYAEITWITDKESNSLVALAEDKEYNPTKKEPYTLIVGKAEEMVTSHKVLIKPLKPNTLYHFQVRSKPLIGPVAKSRDFTFRTLSLKLEIFDISVKVKKGTQAEIFFRTSLPAKVKVRYKDIKRNIEKLIEDKSFLREHKILISNLLADTDYSLVIEVQDEKGKKAVSPKITFSTGKDKKPPKIFEVKTASALSPRGNACQTIISWRTDELSTSRVYYVEGVKWQEKLVKKTPLNKDLSLRHIVVLPELRPGKVYLFKVESIDSSGNVSLSKVYSLYTPQQRKTIIQIMMAHFERIFGWLKNLRF